MIQLEVITINKSMDIASTMDKTDDLLWTTVLKADFEVVIDDSYNANREGHVVCLKNLVAEKFSVVEIFLYFLLLCSSSNRKDFTIIFNFMWTVCSIVITEICY